MEAHSLSLDQLRKNAAECIRLAEEARTSAHKPFSSKWPKGGLGSPSTPRRRGIDSLNESRPALSSALRGGARRRERLWYFSALPGREELVSVGLGMIRVCCALRRRVSDA